MCSEKKSSRTFLLLLKVFHHDLWWSRKTLLAESLSTSYVRGRELTVLVADPKKILFPSSFPSFHWPHHLSFGLFLSLSLPLPLSYFTSPPYPTHPTPHLSRQTYRASEDPSLSQEERRDVSKASILPFAPTSSLSLSLSLSLFLCLCGKFSERSSCCVVARRPEGHFAFAHPGLFGRPKLSAGWKRLEKRLSLSLSLFRLKLGYYSPISVADHLCSRF